MKIRYRVKKFRNKTLELIEQANQIKLQEQQKERLYEIANEYEDSEE